MVLHLISVFFSCPITIIIIIIFVQIEHNVSKFLSFSCFLSACGFDVRRGWSYDFIGDYNDLEYK